MICRQGGGFALAELAIARNEGQWLLQLKH